nr:hypothetical protein [Tanacetum cinerariifolium]
MLQSGIRARFDPAVQRAVNALLPGLTAQITNELRQNGAGGNGDQPPTIHTWLERFGKQKPLSFSFATTPVDAKNWITHIEKLFEVLGCADEFKARLASYKFEHNALSLWKAFKQAKGGEAYQKYEREYHTIRQREDELTCEFMKQFLRLVNTEFTDVAQVANAERNIKLLRERGGSNNKRNRDGDRIQPAARNNNQNGYDQRRPMGVVMIGRIIIRGISVRGEMMVGVMTGRVVIVVRSLISRIRISSTTACLGLRVKRDTLTMPLLLYVIHVGNFIQVGCWVILCINPFYVNTASFGVDAAKYLKENMLSD